MFSVNYPSILSHLGQLAYGFQPVQLKGDGQFVLLIKASKEALLTARLCQQIKIYLVPDEEATNACLGFITAFFDDHDEPLVIFSPLYSADALLTDLVAVITQDSFELYFFDEHDREMMGVSARLEEKERFISTMGGTRFRNFNINKVENSLSSMGDWFGRRTDEDDDRAFIVKFKENLYPDDLVIIDSRPEAYDFQGAEKNLDVTSLERDEPGSFQERDIVRMLQRSFSGDCIFLNPVRIDSDTELADILCHTDEVLLVVQAKDSPNNEATLKRTIDRKRSAIRSHIKKGAGQLRGALSYITSHDDIYIRTSSGARTLAAKGRLVFGLVVVRELFDDDYKPCSSPVLAVARDNEAPCVLLDYAALHVMTLHLGTSDRLINVLLQMFDVALENGEYPKPRFIGRPSDETDK